MEKRCVQTAGAPAAVGPYSQAIQAGGWIFCAGQIPLDPAEGKLVSGGIEEQTRRVVENLKAVLEAAGSSLNRVVKTTVFLVDLNDFAAMNEGYAEFLGDSPPARSTVQVAALPRGARVEIEAVALGADPEGLKGIEWLP
jgi:2-iminobutanoate/2-iminopropanoate deaminase